jgi:integrase/recombinase XerD
MRQRTVRIMLRVKQGQGQQRYYPAVLAANGTVKPFYAQIAGKAECREDGVYYLRYTDSGKKRHYQYVGTDPKLARTMQLQRQHVIAGEKIGLETVEPPPAPKPIKIIPIGPPSVAPLVNPLASPPDPFSKRLPLAATIDQFVRETTITRNPKTGSDYRFKLASFLKVCTKTYLDEIGDEDVIAYVAALRSQGLSLRTIENRCTVLNAFLRRHNFKDKVKKRFVPKATEKVVSAYSSAEVKAILAAATPEERILFRFFLGLGMREREVMFAAWQDIDFDKGLFKVTEKRDAGFKIKDREERLIPIDSQLLVELKKRYKLRIHDRWIFPTDRGLPDGHMLRRLQELGLREGLNCGQCRTRSGASCRDHACCKQLGLHKFRRTYATLHHEQGVSMRTLMDWLGHSMLETTIRYLAAADAGSQKIRLLVDQTWAALG